MIDLTTISPTTFAKGTQKGDGTITPLNIVKDMVDLLFKDIGKDKHIKEYKFIDICCKSGNFLREIYVRLMNHPDMISEYEDTTYRSEYILNNMLYGICFRQTDAMLSTRNVYGRIVSDSHIVYIDGWEELVKTENDKLTIDTLKEHIGFMKFDVVVGNPPYNKGADIDFIDLGYKLLKNDTGKLCMITPAKWQNAEANQKIQSKMSYGEFRKQLVPHIVEVNFIPDSYDIFNAELTGGITYFLIDKTIHDKAKVVNSSKLQPLINSTEYRCIHNEQSLYNVGNALIESLSTYPKFKFKEENKRYQVWTNSQFNIGGGHRKSGSGASDGGGNGGYLFSLSGNLLVTSTSRILDTTIEESTVGASKCSFSSDNRQECEYFVSWLNTKFVRFLIMINASKLTGILTDYYFRFVPDPGAFDHIFTDQELYEKYNLTQEEINIIEAVIKERK